MAVYSIRNRSGFTLFELLISILMLGFIVAGLYQVLGTALDAYQDLKERQALLDMARFAMDRMVRFAQETDEIGFEGSLNDQLRVSERVLDTYDNVTRAYLVDGDGILDADHDANGFVNDSASDPKEYITFRLLKAPPGNWRIREQRPDYSTGATGDTLPWEVICEHVTDFNVQRLADNLVQIKLTVAKGDNVVSLQTRVKPRFVD